jgi:hypothetical protein
MSNVFILLQHGIPIVLKELKKIMSDGKTIRIRQIQAAAGAFSATSCPWFSDF